MPDSPASLSTLPAKPKLNLLVAFPYVTPAILQTVQALGDDCRFLVDSGAFTVWKSGETITLDGYCRFLEGLPVRPWRYFSLDVIGDQDATRRNYETMLRRGFAPIPIITRGGASVLALMDEYYRSTDVVAFGGMAQGNVRPQAFVKAVMQHAAGRWVHLLGFTDFRWLKFVKPYMADSSSWTEADRYGWLRVYRGDGNWFRTHKRDFAEQQPPDALLNVIRGFGFDPYVLRGRAGWNGDNGASRWITCASWIAASIDVERHLGTKMFISLAANRADLLADCYRIALGEVQGEVARQACIQANEQRKAAA